MPLYTMSQASILKHARQARKLQIWVYCLVAVFLILALYIRSCEQTGPSHPRFGFFEGAFIALFVALMQLIGPFPWHRSLLEFAKRAAFTVEIDADEIDVSGELYRRRIPTSEVLKAEEPSWGSGLYLRTAKRYQWVWIPRRVDGFEEIKKYLTLIGISTVRATIPGNWEEYLFVVLFCGSLMCDIATSRPLILSGNLGVSLLLGFAGILFSRAVQDRKMRLMSLAGSFIPAIAAFVALLVAKGRL